MKNTAIFLLITFVFSISVFAQTPKQIAANGDSVNASSRKKVLGDEAEEYQKAVSQILPQARIESLQKFIENFPESERKVRALELIVSSRAEIADQKLRLNETEAGVDLFKLAVIDAPTPISDKLFSEVILNILTNLFYRSQVEKAYELAKLVEEKIGKNAKQLLGLATFHIGTENGEEAKRLAEKAIVVAPDLPAAYQTLGFANRINFDLEESEKAYAKALELDANSIVSRRSLAEIKRAVGKPSEAAALFREVLEVDPKDNASRTGLVLSLFNAGERKQAEEEMTKAFEQNPRNLFLYVGASYWYAANGEGEKAIEFAEKAVAIEPRYTWAQIALARGLIEQKRPLEAEKALLKAQQYGNFPTLNYEIATARMEAGLFREAAEELKKAFTVVDGKIMTYLGGRVFKEADSFVELLEAERRASIFEPNPASKTQTAAKLKTLLKLQQELEEKEIAEEKVTETIDEFVAGEDNMKLHRQLFSAQQLVEKKIALPKALALTEAATGGIESALDVPSPAAAVLAEQLYDSRKFAFTRNELVIVPEIPPKTLSKILRGKIEEITGWALYQQENQSEAITRLRRAVSILPEKSAWWRSSMWRLGAALERDGEEKKALDSYIASYDINAQTQGKRFVIEMLYRKLNGSLDGLDNLIGPNPFIETKSPDEQTVSQTVEKKPTPVPRQTPKAKIPDRVPIAEITTSEKPAENAGETLIQKPTEAKTESDSKPVDMNAVIEDLKSKIAEADSKPTETFENTSDQTDENSEDVKVILTPTTENPENVEPIPTPTPEDSESIEVSPTPTPEKVADSDIKPTPTPTPEVPILQEFFPFPATTPTPTPTPEPDLVADNDLLAEARGGKSLEIVTLPKSETETVPTPTPETEDTAVISEDLSADAKNSEKPTENKTNTPEDSTAKKQGEKIGVSENPLGLPDSLFEPIVIKIPKKKNTENAANTDPKETENSEAKPTETEKPADADATEENNVTLRPRFVESKENNDPGVPPPPIEEIKPCEVKVSQENITIINNGGSMVVLVNIEGQKDLSKLKASTNSPADIKIEFEPEIGGASGQAIFIVKSISDNPGEYIVIFEAPCGRKQVTVSVR